MSDKVQDNKDFDSANLLFFLLRWRKPLSIITIVAAIVSAGASFVITPKFKSTVIMFPATTNSLAKALFSDDPQGQQDVLKFGEEEEAEQLLQILNSDEIRERVTRKYDLMNHYEIDPEEQYKMTKLIEEYEDNVSFKKTEFQSVRIDVLDKDPQQASDMANDIADYVDTVKNRMHQDRAGKTYRIIEKEYLELKQSVEEREDSVGRLRAKGVLHYELQIERLTEQYATAIVEGKQGAAKMLKADLDTIAKYGGAFIALRERLWKDRDKLSELKFKYREARVDVEEQLPHKFIVNKGFPAEKKTYPIRWLIVVVSTFSAFLIGVLAIITLENVSRYRELQEDG